MKRPSKKVPELNDALITHIERLVERTYSDRSPIGKLIPEAVLAEMRRVAESVEQEGGQR